MDPQSLDYWTAQSNYSAPPCQATVAEMPPDLSRQPSLSLSPAYQPHIVNKPMQLGSDSETHYDYPYCSHPLLPHTEKEPVPAHNSAPTERTLTNEGLRRAKNRAAQRAFRERKEKHTQNLEAQLSFLTDKHAKLQVAHSKLHAAHETLRKAIRILAQNSDAEGEIENRKSTCEECSHSDTLRALGDIE